MGIKIILMICIYPVLFILHFALKYQADSSARARRIYFGVKLTAEQAAAPEVRKVSDDYNRLLGILLAVFAVLPLPALFIPWFSVYFTFQMLWMFAVIAGYLLAFVSANGKLKQIKREKGWRREEEPAVRAAYPGGRRGAGRVLCRSFRGKTAGYECGDRQFCLLYSPVLCRRGLDGQAACPGDQYGK